MLIKVNRKVQQSIAMGDDISRVVIYSNPAPSLKVGFLKKKSTY